MRKIRSLTLSLMVCLICLFVTADTSSRAEAQYRGGGGYYHNYGGYHYPHYWNNWHTYQPYRAYSPYSNWYGTYGGYYGSTYPYYSWSAGYPWGWY